MKFEAFDSDGGCSWLFVRAHERKVPEAIGAGPNVRTRPFVCHHKAPSGAWAILEHQFSLSGNLGGFRLDGSLASKAQSAVDNQHTREPKIVQELP